MGRVVVVGSVNVDLMVRGKRLPGPGETVSGGTFARHGGGKGANQAVAAARLGAQVTMIGAVGGDELGEEALRLLDEEGIETSEVARLDGVPTGVALIVVDAAGENQIAVAPGANARLPADHVERALAAVARSPAAGGGTAVTLLGFEAPDAAVLAGARGAPGPVVCNPAPARTLPDGLAELHPILTPNAGEAQHLTGEDDTEDAARTLAERTGAPVLVTLGARGVLLLDGSEARTLAPPRVTPVDTTGAGDAFKGALAAALAGGRELHDAAAFAVAAAARSTEHAGAREGMPRAGAV
jgi:ribokinase